MPYQTQRCTNEWGKTPRPPAPKRKSSNKSSRIISGIYVLYSPNAKLPVLAEVTLEVRPSPGTNLLGELASVLADTEACEKWFRAMGASNWRLTMEQRASVSRRIEHAPEIQNMSGFQDRHSQQSSLAADTHGAKPTSLHSRRYRLAVAVLGLALRVGVR